MCVRVSAFGCICVSVLKPLSARVGFAIELCVLRGVWACNMVGALLCILRWICACFGVVPCVLGSLSVPVSACWVSVGSMCVRYVLFVLLETCSSSILATD